MRKQARGQWRALSNMDRVQISNMFPSILSAPLTKLNLAE
jgi:hypothetical protein